MKGVVDGGDGHLSAAERKEPAWEAEAVLFGERRFFASEGGVDNGSYGSDGFLDLLFGRGLWIY